jgi:hypothetical protein
MPRPRHDTAASPPQDWAAVPPQTPHPPLHNPIDAVFTDDLLHALIAALPSPDWETESHKTRRRAAAVVALRSFDAQDPAEAMLATHAVLTHHFAMECYRRAATSSRTADLNTRLLGTAAMLSRTLGGTLHALRERQDEAYRLAACENPPPLR